MGTGCEHVTRMAGGDFSGGSDVIVGRWKDGRIGTVRTLRPYGQWGGFVIRPKQMVSIHAATTLRYGPIVRQIVAFFQTGKPPAPNDETLEMFAFMDAAQRSKAANGQPMPLR